MSKKVNDLIGQNIYALLHTAHHQELLAAGASYHCYEGDSWDI